MSASFNAGVDGCAETLLGLAMRQKLAIDSVATNDFKACEETINIENFT